MFLFLSLKHRSYNKYGCYWGDIMYKVLIFGTGSGCQQVIEIIDYDKAEIIAYIDNDLTKVGDILNNKPIISPREIDNYKYDYILVASQYYNEINEQLIKLGVNKKKVFSFFKLGVVSVFKPNQFISLFDQESSPFVKIINKGEEKILNCVTLKRKQLLKKIIAIEKNSSNVGIIKNNNPKRVLFNLFNGNALFHVCTESSLAKALQLRGHKVNFLICDNITKLSNYSTFDLSEDFFSIIADKFKLPYDLYSSHLKSNKINRIEQNINRLDPYKYYGYEYKGIKVGKHAKTSVDRFFKGEKVDVKSYNNIFKKELVNACIVVEVAKSAYEIYQPDVLVTSHGVYSSWGPFYDYFKKQNIDTHIYGIDHYTFDGIAFDRDNSFNEYFKKVRNESYLNNEEEQELFDFIKLRMSGKNGDTSYYDAFKTTDDIGELINKIKFDNFEKNYALFANLPWDASLFDSHTVFKDVYEWVKETIDFFREKKSLQLIIKVHPAERVRNSKYTVSDFIKAHYNYLPSNIKILEPDTKIKAYDLFKYIDAGIVYNGTVGMELALNKIPVITCGRAHYSGKGFTIDIRNKEMYREVLINLNYNFDEKKYNLAKVYSYFYFIKSSLPYNLLKFSGDSWAETDMNIESLNDLLPGKNKYLDNICDSIINNKMIQEY